MADRQTHEFNTTNVDVLVESFYKRIVAVPLRSIHAQSHSFLAPGFAD